MKPRDARQPPCVEIDGDVMTVTLSDNPVRDAEDLIVRQVENIPSVSNQHLQLDFINVDYLNGIELGTLIALHKRVRRAGGRLTLLNVAAHLRELFTVTRLDTVLTLCELSNCEPCNSEQLESDKPQKNEVQMTNINALPTKTDREMVLSFQPTARVESRANSRSDRPQFRVVRLPVEGQRVELGPWCGSEERAWEAACLRQGLRLCRIT